MDFTVIVSGRCHFGDDPDFLPGTFVGPDAQFPFDCPGVDPTQPAVLMFQSLDVDNERNVLEINGSGLPGGIPQSPADAWRSGGIPVSSSRDCWTSNLMVVAAGTLGPAGNSLHVGSRDEDGTLVGNIDDFLIDNVVILYKTRPR